MTDRPIIIRAGEIELFKQKGSLDRRLDSIKKEIEHEIDNYPSEYIQNVDEYKLFEYLVSKYSLEAPSIEEDKIEIESAEHKSAQQDKYLGLYEYTIAVPFIGDEDLLKYTPSPSQYHLLFPRAVIKNQEIYLHYGLSGGIPTVKQELKQKYNLDIGLIKKYTKLVKNQLDIFNVSLEPLIKQQVTQRKERISDSLSAANFLGIPLRQRNNLPEPYLVPISHEKLEIKKPPRSVKISEPNWLLQEEDYENILNIIFHMSLVMERNPKTFSKLTEEEVRDHFLIFLNAFYEGQATGETFNFVGKTDILIRVEDKNAFIAECKFWDGPKKLAETIDQLLSYTSWRDTKTAILLFNKNLNFSSVLRKIESKAILHACYLRPYKLNSNKLKKEAIYSYIFHQPNDKSREIILTIMAFDIPRIESDNEA